MAEGCGLKVRRAGGVNSTLAFPCKTSVPSHNSKTVLVVDDDQDLISLVAMVLESEGYGVQTAADGREALEAVERGMPDLILLDMKMPIMDGWEFAREFRTKYDLQSPIVVMTAAADARQCTEEIGAVGWIGKPFDLDMLVGAVGRWGRRERLLNCG